MWEKWLLLPGLPPLSCQLHDGPAWPGSHPLTDNLVITTQGQPSCPDNVLGASCRLSLPGPTHLLTIGNMITKRHLLPCPALSPDCWEYDYWAGHFSWGPKARQTMGMGSMNPLPLPRVPWKRKDWTGLVFLQWSQRVDT